MRLARPRYYPDGIVNDADALAAYRQQRTAVLDSVRAGFVPPLLAADDEVVPGLQLKHVRAFLALCYAVASEHQIRSAKHTAALRAAGVDVEALHIQLNKPSAQSRKKKI